MFQKGLTLIITETTIKKKNILQGKHEGSRSPICLAAVGLRVALCQNTPCMSVQRSGLGKKELALLTLSGQGRKVGGLRLTEPTERVSISHRVAGLGHRKSEGKNNPPPAKCYRTVSGKSTPEVPKDPKVIGIFGLFFPRNRVIRAVEE